MLKVVILFVHLQIVAIGARVLSTRLVRATVGSGSARIA